MSLPQVGKYKLIAELGRGGMADVLLAVTEGTAAVDFTKLVVIKKIREEFADDLDFVTMLMDEARIAARLNHPNVVQTNEVGQSGNDFFLAMEFLDGQTFGRVVQRAKNTLPRAMHLSILSEVLSGVHYAHELKDYDGTPLSIVHRDVTPHNIFVTYDGQVKVMDFGIAKAAGRATKTRAGVVKGKVGYMAPEQVLGSTDEIDRRVDVFAVGVMLYEACTGGRMWRGVTDTDVLRRLARHDVPRSPRAIVDSVPEALDRICHKALAPRPEDRYATAAALQADLDDYITDHEKRPPIRRVGAFVSELFADRRTAASAVIETQLATLTSAKKSQMSVVTITPDAAGDVPQSSSSAVSLTFTPSLPRSIPPDDIPTNVGETTGAVTQTNTTPSAPQHAAEERPAPRNRRMALLAAIGAAAMIVAVVGGRNALRAAAAPPTVNVTLRATPDEARFSIDDGPAVTNPYVAELPRDEKMHRIRTFAPGYDDKDQQLPFASDVSLRVSLAKHPAR